MEKTVWVLTFDIQYKDDRDGVFGITKIEHVYEDLIDALDYVRKEFGHIVKEVSEESSDWRFVLDAPMKTSSGKVIAEEGDLVTIWIDEIDFTPKE